MLDYHPLTATEQRTRWPAATAKEWDFTELVGQVPLDADRPGLHPENLFDFHDGLRLIVSIDKYNFGTYLHVSASAWPATKVYVAVRNGKMNGKNIDALVAERVRFLCGRNVALGYVTGRGISHYFDPPLQLE
jgi:hypothetical protein